MPEEIVRVNEANQKSDRLEKQVATPADFTSPEVLYEDLIQEIRKYHPSSDLSDIERAYKIARDAHEGQKRRWIRWSDKCPQRKIRVPQSLR